MNDTTASRRDDPVGERKMSILRDVIRRTKDPDGMDTARLMIKLDESKIALKLANAEINESEIAFKKAMEELEYFHDKVDVLEKENGLLKMELERLREALGDNVPLDMLWEE